MESKDEKRWARGIRPARGEKRRMVGRKRRGRGNYRCAENNRGERSEQTDREAFRVRKEGERGGALAQRTKRGVMGSGRKELSRASNARWKVTIITQRRVKAWDAERKKQSRCRPREDRAHRAQTSGALLMGHCTKAQRGNAARNSRKKLVKCARADRAVKKFVNRTVKVR